MNPLNGMNNLNNIVYGTTNTGALVPIGTFNPGFGTGVNPLGTIGTGTGGSLAAFFGLGGGGLGGNGIGGGGGG